MRTFPAFVLSLLSLSLAGQAQTTPQAPASPAVPVVGDRTTALRALAGTDNPGVSNAVLRDQEDVRVLRVMVEPGGTRVMHSHDDVRFHLFVPVTGPMTMTVEGSQPIVVPPWQPFYMKAATKHTFKNTGSTPVEIIEVFVKK